MQISLSSYLYAVILGQCSKNALKLPRIGSIILTIISLNLAVSHLQRPPINAYVKAYSRADLFLDNNHSVITKMGSSDTPKANSKCFSEIINNCPSNSIHQSYIYSIQLLT